MRYVVLIFLVIVFNSCFLFNDLKRTDFLFSENGTNRSVNAVIPKKYNRTEKQVDSTGNQVQYYFYPGGTVLYFALMKDTSSELQPIDYNQNIPKPLYQTVFFKGLDSAGHYWRETRFGNYKAGYKNVNEGDDGKFDSSINYFSLHIEH